MKQAKGLTLSDKNFINSTCCSIFNFEKHGLSDSALRQQIYMLGLYSYSQFHKVGFPSDMRNPRILEKILR